MDRVCSHYDQRCYRISRSWSSGLWKPRRTLEADNTSWLQGWYLPASLDNFRNNDSFKVQFVESKDLSLLLSCPALCTASNNISLMFCKLSTSASGRFIALLFRDRCVRVTILGTFPLHNRSSCRRTVGRCLLITFVSWNWRNRIAKNLKGLKHTARFEEPPLPPFVEHLIVADSPGPTRIWENDTALNKAN